jgi:hypothetical protein
MNPYLAKLRARDQEAGHPQEPSKPSKPIVPVVTYGNTTHEIDFEGFEGDRARRFSGNERATKAIGQISLDRLGRAFEYLESRCPDHVPANHWQQAVEDGSRFLAQWGERAVATPTGAVTVYRRHNKRALGTLGDSLDDFR